MIDIDASHGEGGGQLVRTAVALAAVTGAAICLRGMRAGRPKPGLAAQHLTAVRAVAALCDADTEGLALGATRIVFSPRSLCGGEFEFHVGTAGSVPLVLQALLPVMVASGQRIDVRITGGTDVRAAPPLDYLAHVLLPLVHRLGARATLRCLRRGYYPKGGGIVEATVMPGALAPVPLDLAGALSAIRAVVHTSHLPRHVGIRMRDAALACLPRDVRIEIAVEEVEPSAATGPGGAIVLWGETEGALVGAGRVAQRGVTAETLGHEAGAELAADLRCGATLDVHATDQMLVYFALAGGGAFLTRAVSLHARTTMWLIERMLPVRFRQTACGGLLRVGVEPLGAP